MEHFKRPRSSLIALLLSACSGSGEDEAKTPSYQQQDGFIAPQEAAADDERPDAPSSVSDEDVDVEVPSVPFRGESGSGVVVAEEDGAAWLIPDDGASFTGPPLQAGEGPVSADTCPGQDLVATEAESVGEDICFFSEDDPETPAARINQVIESVEGQDFSRIRLTLNPNFVDNSYGATAVGWGAGEMPAGDEAPVQDGKPPKKMKVKTHAFKDLVGSDHAEIKLTDAAGEVVLHVKVDYLSEDPDAPSGFSSLGVTGGEGEVLVGDPAWVLEATTSLDRNLNACGHASFTEDSPQPPTVDEPGEAEDWDYRVVYEVWVSLDAFADEGFGEAAIEFVHASPSKGSNNTVEVTSGPCPPGENPPGGGGGAGGAGGSPGTTGGGGSSSGGAPAVPSGIDKAR
jgi:hypothetical protein